LSGIKDPGDYAIIGNIYRFGLGLIRLNFNAKEMSTEEFSLENELCEKLAESFGLKEKWDKFFNEKLYKTTSLVDYFENTFKEIQHLYEQGGPDFALKGLSVHLHRMFKRQPDLPVKIFILPLMNLGLMAVKRKYPEYFSGTDMGKGLLEAIGLGAAATFVKRCLERSDQHNIQIMEEEWNKADEILRLYLVYMGSEPLMVLAAVENFLQEGPLPGDSDFLPEVKWVIDLIDKNVVRVTFPPH
jgi:hypothetical protein